LEKKGRTRGVGAPKLVGAEGHTRGVGAPKLVGAEGRTRGVGAPKLVGAVVGLGVSGLRRTGVVAGAALLAAGAAGMVGTRRPLGESGDVGGHR
jgi:hypothetical protein